MADKEFLMTRLRTFFLDPDTFFRELAAQPPRYRWPLLIVLVAGIFSAIASLLQVYWLSSIIRPEYFGVDQSWELYPFVLFTMISMIAVSMVISYFLVPVVAGLIFYILAGFIAKTGSVVHTFTAVCWGMVPLAVYEFVQIPLFFLFLPFMDIAVSPEFIPIMNKSMSGSALDNAMRTHMIIPNHMYVTHALVNNGLHVLAYLCCAWFWIPAVRNTCSVSHRQALAIVLVPLLLFLTFSAAPVFIRNLQYL